LQLIHPTKVITKQGECEITLKLELNININANGGVNVSASSEQVNPPQRSLQAAQPSQEDPIDWVIPDFGPTEKINFGKHVKE